MWTKVYRLNKSEEIQKDTLSYQTLVNDFQKKMKISRLDARSQIAKKSFRPTFAEKSAEDETDMSDSSTESKQKKKKKQTDKQFFQNTEKDKKQHSQINQTTSSLMDSQTTDQTTSSLTERMKCCACKQDHDFCVCYYLFLNKASD